VKRNPLKELGSFGQSLWIDYIRRDLIVSGKLKRMIAADGLRGMTSNPTIFEKAITGSHDYQADIRSMGRAKKSVDAIYEALSQADVRGAADAFRPLYDRTGGADGYVSLEVNPHLARDTKGTINEGRRLWKALNRPNVMIKVPATAQGLPAIERLISEGINVNVTLLFGLPRYRKVAQAYCAGIQTRLSQGKPVHHIASVASFFVSRIDTMVDPMLDAIVGRGGPRAALAKRLRGEVAVASAKAAYQIYKEMFEGPAFIEAFEDGARPQRVLWASTGTKNPKYSDVKYVEALVGPHTVDTAPPETIDAYRDHGRPKARLVEGVEKSFSVLRDLAKAGIGIDAVTQKLEDEGVDKFNQPFDKLMDALDKARK
jgi:transaldolase